MRTIIATIFFTLFLYVNNLYSQCNWNTSWYQYPSTIFTTTSSAWTTVSSANYAGDYAIYNVTNGNSYEWSLCASDGGNCSYDGYLTLFDGSTNTTITYNDDFCSDDPKITWTATFTGTVKVLITAYQCNTNTTNTTVVWRCSSNVVTDPPTTGDCLGAIKVCNNLYSYSGSVSGIGNVNDLGVMTSCGTYEQNSTWYTFNVMSAGNFMFTLNSSTDYDWALFDITSPASCNDIFDGTLNAVRCNWSATVGNTGMSGIGTNTSEDQYGSVWCSPLAVTQGQTFALLVDNYNGGTVGYSLDFGTGTASIIDNTPPYLLQIVDTPSCGQNTITFNFNENVDISSVTTNDFTITMDANTYFADSIFSSNDTSFDDTFTIILSSGIVTSGIYSLNIVGQVNDACGNIVTTSSLTFSLSGITVDYSLSNPSCFNGNDGAIALSVNGGMPPFIYQWSNGATTSSITGLSVGDYTVTVTDNNGLGNCFAVKTITLQNKNVLFYETFDTIPVLGWTSGATGTNSWALGQPQGGKGSSIISNPDPITDYSSSSTNNVYGQGLGTANLGGYNNNSNEWLKTPAINCSGTSNVQLSFWRWANFENNYDEAYVEISTNGTSWFNLEQPLYPIDNAWTNVIIDISQYADNQPIVYIRWRSTSDGTTTYSGWNIDDVEVFTSLDSISSNLTATDVLCNGQSTGSISLIVSGGSPSYSFNWSNGQTAQNISSLNAGIYTVTLTDSNLCQKIDSVEITEPDSLFYTLSVTQPLCGANNGAIDLTLAGGTPSYFYNWSNGQTTEDIVSLNSGTYYLTVTDSNSCIEIDSVTLNQQPALTLSATFTEPACNMSDGAIDLTVTGGTPPYSYSWSNGQTSEDISLLSFGIYAVTISDSFGCSDTLLTILNNNSAPNISLTNLTNISCNNQNNGSIDISISGGTTPYNFSWNNSSTDEDLINLIAGNYIVTVTDAILCKAIASYSVIQPDSIVLSLSITDVTCYGDSIGAIDLTVIGGTFPYSYIWSTGDTTSSIENLSSNNYSVTVTDANNCTENIIGNITEPSALIIFTSRTDVSCYGLCDGSANVSVSGGSGYYNYVWSNALTTNSINNLCAGLYSVTVYDANSTPECNSTANVSVSEPTEIILTTSSVNSNCGLSDGSAIVVVNNSSLNYTYNWVWVSGSNTSTSVLNTDTVYSLPAGLVYVTVTLGNNCSNATIININENLGITSTITSTDATSYGACDGTATVNVTGGLTPYYYSWNIIPSQNTSIVTGLCAGDYSVTILDSNGCALINSVTISQPETPIILNIIKFNAFCYGDSSGEVDLTVTGGTTPYAYLWSNGATTEDLQNISAGVYSITVTDANSDFAIASVTITQPPILLTSCIATNINCNGEANATINLTVSGGTSSYIYYWSNGSITPFLTNIGAGIYSVTVTDANGCTATNPITITEPMALVLSLNSTNATCGNSNASIDLSVSGGAAPYYYLWSTGHTSQDISNIYSGSYSVTVTDIYYCTASKMVVINSTPLMSYSISNTNISNVDSCDGTATILVSSGTAPYTYSWNTIPEQNTETAVGLCSGNYTVTVTDASGCNLIESVTISEFSAPVILYTVTNINCFGESTATIDIEVIDGTPPYTYLWSNGQVTQDLSGLPSGNYTITVTDNNSLTAVSSVFVSQPTELILSVSAVNVSNTGANDGSATVTVSGGLSPYTYLWSNSAVTQNISNLTNGDYCVSVQDFNGCMSDICATIIIEQVIATDTILINSSNNLQTFNSCNAIIYDNGGEFGNYSNNTDYYITIASQNGGCVRAVLKDYNIEYNYDFLYFFDGQDTLSPQIGKKVHASPGTPMSTMNLTGNAYYASSGFLTIKFKSDAATVKPGFSIKVDCPENCEAPTCSGTQPAGEYCNTATLICKSAGYCGNTSSAYPTDHGEIDAYNLGIFCGGINNNSWLSFIADSSTVIIDVWVRNCQGISGQLLGIQLAVFSTDCSYGNFTTVSNCWSPSEMINGQLEATGLTVGEEYLIMIDGYAQDVCEYTVFIESNNSLSTINVDAVTNNVTCYGTSTGSINISASGGNTPYVYNWSSGSTTEDLYNIPANNYTITVTDYFGCTGIETFEVSQPMLLQVTLGSVSPICSPYSSNGMVFVEQISGGTSPYTYYWGSGNYNDTLYNISSGNYSLLTTDANNCSTNTPINVDYIKPPVIYAISKTDVSCYGSSDGQATITIKDGTAPFTFNWTPNNGNGNLVNDSTLIISNLAPAYYSVTIYDAKGCDTSTTFLINQPLQINIFANYPNTICPNDSATLSVSVIGGTPPYLYNWIIDSSYIAGNVVTIHPDSTSSYTVIVQDSKGCEKQSPFIIFVEQSISFTTNYNNTCVGDSTGSIILIPDASGNYSYNWSTGDTLQSINGLQAGTYFYTVTSSCNNTVSGSQDIIESGLAYINGTVNYSSGFVAAGDAEITLYNADVSGFNVIANTILGNNGSFNINDISQGNYWLKVDLLNHSGYPQLFNTYYDSTYKWFEATTLSLICGDSLNLNITMAENIAQSIGNGTINGNIIWVSNNKAINGIPVTGADFILEKEPDNEPVTETISDISGNYSMADILYGNYTIYVDIPGIPLITTHNFIINATDSVFNNLNFYVDTITNFGIYADTLPLNIPLIADNFTINVNPNPFNNELNINYSINKTCDVSIELFDITGKKISSLQNIKQEKGNYSMKYNKTKDSVKPGVYFLKIIVGNEVYVKKIVKE
ncbi:MAG: hypothetical protein A2033_12910 [Bacteroidetes bacterium GWA2_31_9]|nr:MAG: hypothetical protein A2033_12910 [Bacteroidetes bacterium GWA2_31_9]